jgi:hypothetical protein
MPLNASDFSLLALEPNNASIHGQLRIPFPQQNQ